MSDLKLSTEELTHLWQAAQDQAVTGVPAPFHFAKAVVELQARRTQPEATVPTPELMGYWYWDEGGLRDAPEWRMGGIKRPPADWPKNKRLNLYAGAPAQDLSAAILALPLPEMEYIGSGGNLGYTEVKMRDLLKAAAALASSANALSAGDSQKALDALLTRIDDAFESYERFGAICEFEGQPMIYADTLTEIVTLRGEYHALFQSQNK